MSRFEDQLGKDLEKVFFNTGDSREFAAKHMWNGAEVDGTLMDEKENPVRALAEVSRNGLVTRRKVFFAAVSAFSEAPVTGLAVSLNGEDYMIEHVADECGVFEIHLSITEGR